MSSVVVKEHVSWLILWLGLEDYGGLWEVIWELSSNYPKWSDEKKHKFARDIVGRLHSEGFLRFYLYQEPDGKLTRISSNKIQGVFNNKVYWEPPDFKGVSVRFETNKLGEQRVNDLANTHGFRHKRGKLPKIRDDEQCWEGE